jgi:hypothetical protein
MSNGIHNKNSLSSFLGSWNTNKAHHLRKKLGPLLATLSSLRGRLEHSSISLILFLNFFFKFFLYFFRYFYNVKNNFFKKIFLIYFQIKNTLKIIWIDCKILINSLTCRITLLKTSNAPLYRLHSEAHNCCEPGAACDELFTQGNIWNRTKINTVQYAIYQTLS